MSNDSMNGLKEGHEAEIKKDEKGGSIKNGISKMKEAVNNNNCGVHVAACEAVMCDFFFLQWDSVSKASENVMSPLPKLVSNPYACQGFCCMH